MSGGGVDNTMLVAGVYDYKRTCLFVRAGAGAGAGVCV